MGDISKIKVDDIEYDVKDAVARTKLGTVDATEIGYLDGVTSNIQTQLNGKQRNAVKIEPNQDLNDLISVGTYFCSANVTSESLVNCPTTYAFTLNVAYHAGYYQRLVTYRSDTPEIYFRNYANSAWGNWFKEYTTVDSPLPVVTTADNGKVLKVVNGVWTAVAE